MGETVARDCLARLCHSSWSSKSQISLEGSIPTRDREWIAVAMVMLVLSTFFTVWRVIVRCKASTWMGWSDWLMILGVTVSNAGMIVTIVCGFNGAGRLLRDHFWKPNAQDMMIYQNHLTFASQLLNIYGMWIVKLSICAYLLALNFTRSYRRVIWGTIVFVTIFNFLLPATQHFGLCRPLASRWDTQITNKQCWSQMVRISIAYTQAISNIVTDLIYATAPIVYLRSVQLSKRTQWSVRVVFLMSLICTTISALKLWDFQRIQGVKEVYYESVTLSIWGMTEVSAGIVVANLPPLRKSFDSFFKHIAFSVASNTVFSGNKSSGTGFENFNLQTDRSQPDRKIADDDSDRAILDETEGEGGRRGSGIVRITRISVD
ncbi:hypothetical protein FB567DRAFT_541392 [Paraphoma chrysanthemicola]|uniref:Rhodopsin domain-containing protein n=1 Tax=Paraphoma chrysanthemicola TaxID=798071 RepID=A0A8K0QSC6_9PLEO|nr:hypothetical protein FB567DRAFT_541392 [Paraphoma chrysanthemicola]